MTTDTLHRPDFRPLSAAGLPASDLPTSERLAPKLPVADLPAADLSMGAGAAELSALIRSLLQTCSDLQQRVSELELTDRLRARRNPSHSLGIDY